MSATAPKALYLAPALVPGCSFPLNIAKVMHILTVNTLQFCSFGVVLGLETEDIAVTMELMVERRL